MKICSRILHDFNFTANKPRAVPAFAETTLGLISVDYCPAGAGTAGAGASGDAAAGAGGVAGAVGVPVVGA